MGVSEGWGGEAPPALIPVLDDDGVSLVDGYWVKAHLDDIPAAEAMPYSLVDELSKSYFKAGNKKLGRDTIIFNITSGTDCPCAHDKVCDVLKHCYARADERFRPNALAYRRRQTKFWDSVTPEQFVKAFPVPRYFRFSESGDFRHQADVDKMAAIAHLLDANHGVITYGYTRRSDLDLSKLLAAAVVNGHGFMASNNTVVEEDPKGGFVCPGDCRDCDFCKVARGVDIKFKLRRR
jgi:hypothetical protein